MPPRGGSFVSDADMEVAVQYMLSSVGFETSSPSVESVKIAEAVTTTIINKPVIPAKPKETAKIVVKPKPPEAVKEVSKPVVKVEDPKVVADISTTSPLVTTSPKQGKDIYDITCKSCHIVGIAGAPKITEKKDWIQRLAKGEDMLIQNAINGINIMPPKGGNSKLTEDEVKLAVQYMLKIIPNK